MGYEYLRNESIIRSKTREFFGVGTVVTASAYLVSVVDFMLIGALLGADAVAAAGLCDSFVDVAELFGFVLSSGGPVAAGVLLAIAFEEAALNIINHNEHVSMIDICLLLEEGSLIVRIRDDGAPFDPLAFVDDEDILQMNNIRLLERLTDQKTYTRIMNMNNTVLSIRLEAAENDGANDGTC